MSEKPLKIAIIQLTRIGDLVQTLQAVRQFRGENENIELTLIARRKFAQGIIFLLETVFDEIILFETKDFFAHKNFKDAGTQLSSFIQDINNKQFDVSVNLSYTKSASFLNTLINSQLKLGPARNERAEISIGDNWSQYIFSNVLDNNLSPFNLVDLYRYVLGCQDVHTLNDDAAYERENHIVLHPFASQKKKRWGANRWSELIFNLLKTNPEYKIHIVGAATDHDDANRILHSPSLEKMKDSIFDHTQNGSLTETYRLLLNAKLFIGHDSVVSHLAAETLIPGIILTLGTVKPTETSCYSNKMINITPRNACFPCKTSESCETLPCHNSINQHLVAQIATGVLKEETIDKNFLSNKVNTFHLDNVEVFSSQYNTYGLELVSLTENYRRPVDVFKEFYKIIWQCFLRDHDLNTAIPEITKETAGQLNRYRDGVNYLHEIYSFGIKFSNRIITECEKEEPDIKIINEFIQKTSELDQLVSITKASYPHLQGLIDYVYAHKANAPGENIMAICKDNLITFYDATNLSAVMLEFIDKAVSPHISHVTTNQEL